MSHKKIRLGDSDFTIVLNNEGFKRVVEAWRDLDALALVINRLRYGKKVSFKLKNEKGV